MGWPADSWMDHVDGKKFLSELSIPGTHDTMTGHLAVFHRKIAGFAATQDQHLDEQLRRGIRFIDIRVKRENSKFVNYHGGYYLDTDFRDVMIHCMNFLDKHQRETILLSLKDEHASQPEPWMEPIFHAYLNEQHEGRIFRNYFLATERIPRLDEARGKIVLVRRFGPHEHLGLNLDSWSDNQTFTNDLPGARVHIQDVYSVSMFPIPFFTTTKWDHVKKMLDKARDERDRAGNLYINFTSADGRLAVRFTAPDPRGAALPVNLQLVEYLRREPRAHVGTLVMDFPLEFDTLVELIYGRN